MVTVMPVVVIHSDLWQSAYHLQICFLPYEMHTAIGPVGPELLLSSRQQGHMRDLQNPWCCFSFQEMNIISKQPKHAICLSKLESLVPQEKDQFEGLRHRGE